MSCGRVAEGTQAARPHGAHGASVLRSVCPVLRAHLPEDQDTHGATKPNCRNDSERKRAPAQPKTPRRTTNPGAPESEDATTERRSDARRGKESGPPQGIAPATRRRVAGARRERPP